MSTSIRLANNQKKITKGPKFSFPKTDRFNGGKKFFCDQSYNIPSAVSKRGTSFGYGNKVFLQQNSVSPGPGAYNLSKSLLLKKQVHIGLGRDKATFNSFLPRLDINVGPGQYSSSNNNSLNNSFSKVSYSMGKKATDLTKFNPPGPGRYNVGSIITKDGKNFNSIYQNYGSAQINSSRSERFVYKNSKNLNLDNYPGIGAYNSEIQFKSSKGAYKLSNFKSTFAKSISKSERITIEVNKLCPGPGAYNNPNLFG